jgi:hypothetical protein
MLGSHCLQGHNNDNRTRWREMCYVKEYSFQYPEQAQPNRHVCGSAVLCVLGKQMCYCCSYVAMIGAVCGLMKSSWMLYMQIKSRMTEAFLRVQFDLHCMRRSCTCSCTIVHCLQPKDSSICIQFCRWFLHKTADCYDFLFCVLWTDEAAFVQSGVNSIHNLHPHVTWC